MIKIKNQTERKVKNFWNNAVFHPTDAIEDDWGRHILDTIAEDNAADSVRIYTMFEDIVSKSEDGNLQYDFTLNDHRLDYLLSKGFNIILSFSFIPHCISEDTGEVSSVSKNKTRYKGKLITTSPPTDYKLWEEVCYQYTAHIVGRYGADTVSKWYLQCLNEPDIPEFFMTSLGLNDEAVAKRLESYKKLYEGFVNGTLRACNTLKVGGPALSHRLDFLDGFLQFVCSKKLRLDFVSMHTYGTSPHELNDGTKPFHAENTLVQHLENMEIINKHYPDGIEILVDEWGAATAGYYNTDECPQFIFREDSRFAAYFGKMITSYIEKNISVSKMLICLSGQHEMTTDFSGFRNFFTLNFIKKPIYNAHILARKLEENILICENSNPDLSILATKSDNGKFAILLSYASENFDKALPGLTETLKIDGIYGNKNIKVWKIDEKHTNPYLTMIENGWDYLSKEKIEYLREVGNLKPSKQYCDKAHGELIIDVDFTNNAFVLIEF